MTQYLVILAILMHLAFTERKSGPLLLILTMFFPYYLLVEILQLISGAEQKTILLLALLALHLFWAWKSPKKEQELKD